MAHHDRSIHKRITALAEEGGLSASTVSRSLLQEHGYRNTGGMGKSEGAEELGLRRVSSPAQDAASVAEAQRNPFISVGDLKAATGFPGQRTTLISRLKEAGLRAQHTVVKEILNDKHKLYRLAFTENSVDRKWDRVVLSYESTFSSANDGPV